ncbi:MAG TPA: peptidase-C39 like family protein [Cytophagales bacterium]|jgi:hypothetical protein|nr:peptidase-C39 like family protein [Cytophagales bacterium]
MLPIEQTLLEVPIEAQPDDVTCGPTCLQAVYGYYGLSLPLSRVIRQVKQLKSGGTLAVLLGQDALKRGFQVTIITYNLHMFDPTWFNQKQIKLIEKLREQLEFKSTKKFQFAAESYINFLEKGGSIKFKDLTPTLIRSYLNKNQPILTGLSATYLYNSAREIGDTNTYDDIKGTPTGHFVVIDGYNRQNREALISDPLKPNPISDGQHYAVPIQRLINSIMLGIVTYDANLLIIEPKKKK